jgi:hypothetical protein
MVVSSHMQCSHRSFWISTNFGGICSHLSLWECGNQHQKARVSLEAFSLCGMQFNPTLDKSVFPARQLPGFGVQTG